MARKHQDDDIDDILSGIMSAEKNTHPPKEEVTTPYHPPSKSVKKQKNKSRSINKILRVCIYLMIFCLCLAAVGFGAYKLFPNLLNPTPFNSEIKESVGFQLYYPKSMPENFKIESDSVQEADTGVVVYAVSDDEGHRLTVSMQKTPEDLDLEPLTASLEDSYEVDTPQGKATVGKTENGMLIANLIVDGVWIIVNTPNANVSTDQMNIVLQGLSKG